MKGCTGFLKERVKRGDILLQVSAIPLDFPAKQ